MAQNNADSDSEVPEENPEQVQGGSKEWSVSYTSSELYSLQMLLNWASVELENPQHMMVAQAMSKKINEVIATEKFTQNMEEQVEEHVETVKETVESKKTINDPTAQDRSIYQ